jgi:hypothetical protein
VDDEGVLAATAAPAVVAVAVVVVVVVVVVVRGLQHISASLLLVQAAPPQVTDAALLTRSPLAQNVATVLITLLQFAFETQQSALKQVAVAQTTSAKTALIVWFREHVDCWKSAPDPSMLSHDGLGSQQSDAAHVPVAHATESGLSLR